jgi:uncharacterized protein with HEPN domain
VKIGLDAKTFWNQHELYMLRDQESLIDIANAIKRALRYTNNISRSELEANDEKLSAVLYQIN